MLATGLLGLAGVVYVIATALEPGRPWLHYVAAAAEAAMIGAIADWFAVVALFHHPLNLRFIPHTAILPRNKARIAQGLSDFIQQNFLSSAAVVARIAALRPADTLCGWLLKPENADAVAGYGARLVAFVLMHTAERDQCLASQTPRRQRGDLALELRERRRRVSGGEPEACRGDRPAGGVIRFAGGRQAGRLLPELGRRLGGAA